jgi:hypothetical protein
VSSTHHQTSPSSLASLSLQFATSHAVPSTLISVGEDFRLLSLGHGTYSTKQSMVQARQPLFYRVSLLPPLQFPFQNHYLCAPLRILTLPVRQHEGARTAVNSGEVQFPQRILEERTDEGTVCLTISSHLCVRENPLLPTSDSGIQPQGASYTLYSSQTPRVASQLNERSPTPGRQPLCPRPNTTSALCARSLTCAGAGATRSMSCRPCHSS